jgi:hypothetical protein
MKTDKFLIGIVIGIVLLVIAAIVVVLARGQNEEYVADDTPAGVVHNYFLAVQQKEFDKAYNYLSDEIEAKPTLDEFIASVDNQNESALKIGAVNIDNNRARVEVAITNYYGGGPFDSGRYTNQETTYLRQDDNGNWKIFEFPYPYWGYWNEKWD